MDSSARPAIQLLLGGAEKLLHPSSVLNRRGIIGKSEFHFDCHSVLLQALPPGFES